MKSLAKCNYCSNMLSLLVEDLLDIAKVEKNKLKLNNEFFNLISTVKDAFSSLEYVSNAMGI